MLLGGNGDGSVASTDAPILTRVAICAVPWRGLVAATALSFVLALATAQVLAPGRSTSPAARSGAAHHAGLSSLPLEAQGPISAAIAADDPAYRVVASAGGFRSHSQMQHLSVSFGRSLVTIGSGGASVGLSVRAFGYGSALRPVDAVSPRTRANRVTYAHAGLSEWYVTGPIGLEQGFVASRSPAGPASGPLTVSIGLSGNAYASVDRGGRSLSLSHAGRVSLRYTGLLATDARGRLLRSWLELRPGGLLVRVDTRGARFPVHIDPFVQQGEKLTGSGEVGIAAFGFSVAVSSGGDTALIGGPEDNGATGAAWVFTRSGTTWTQQGSKLVGSGESGKGFFGFSVALSADGNTGLIAGPEDNGGIGAVWAFTRSGTTWTQQGSKLVGGGESGNARFGQRVALSADGNTALVGGYGDNVLVGAAWVFTRSGSTWTQQGSKLVAKSGEEVGAGRFGQSVSLSSDGNSALVGAPFDNGEVGAAWVFTRSGSTWSQQGAKLTGGGETGKGEFGKSVALSGFGYRALIGGEADNGNVGAAWVFTRSGSTWSQEGLKLVGPGETGSGRFGESVVMSESGYTAVIGGPGDNSGVGAAWIYERLQSGWAGTKVTGSGAIGERQFGSAVAISAHGTTALIGGPFDHSNAGAAWVFAIPPGEYAQQGPKLVGGGETGEGAFGVVALSADGNTALVGGYGDNGAAGAAWVFTRSGTTWTQQGSKLTGSGESGAGLFGVSAALSSDGNTALIGGPADNKSAGAAWVFTRAGGVWKQQGSKLVGGGEVGEGRFGSAVALSSDGNTALIGGDEDEHSGVHLGSAWVFTRTGEAWTQQGSKFSGSESSDALFGESVALSSDGNTALIGGSLNNPFEGAAWVFTRSGSTWTQQGGKLTESEHKTGAFFGEAVTLSADGNTALIGGGGVCGEPGGVWVFNRSGGVWTQGEKLTAGAEQLGSCGTFGRQIAFASGANTALISGYDDDAEIGAVWVYTRNGSGVWTQHGPKLIGSGEVGSGQFGLLALSADANTVLIGAPKDNGFIGAAWVFVTPPPEFGRCVKVTAGSGTYENAGCTKLGGEKKYEWSPGFGGPHPLVKTHFTSALKPTTTAILETRNATKVTCTGEDGGGEYNTNKTTARVALRLTGCEGLAQKCSSAGGAEGEIVWNTLEGELGIILASKEPVKDKVGLALKAPGGQITEFACGSTTIKLRGSVIGQVSTKTMTSKPTLKYTQSAGSQKPTHFEGEVPVSLEASVAGGAYESAGLAMTVVQTNAEKVEINPVV
jgi:hypothetical protein